MTKTRRSESCMQELQSSINEDKINPIEKKRVEWEQAVTKYGSYLQAPGK